MLDYYEGRVVWKNIKNKEAVEIFMLFSKYGENNAIDIISLRNQHGCSLANGQRNEYWLIMSKTYY